ncbi:MAG: Gfo/Idh/MocA family oxidoreductase, partial [Phycisphaerae bacterium]|nr:Gfo/Idh/MocA family oxidoreductase [Phycisphaerae bacterium]
MNPSPDVVPVAAIGVGRMGRHHARIYHQMAEADLVAVVDPDLDRAGALADEYGCDALATVGELLDRHPQVAAASIAVPTVLH